MNCLQNFAFTTNLRHCSKEGELRAEHAGSEARRAEESASAAARRAEEASTAATAAASSARRTEAKGFIDETHSTYDAFRQTESARL
jgi:hypothetical protein